MPPNQRNQSTQANQKRRSTMRKNLKILLLVLVMVTTGYAAYRISQPSRPEIMGFLWPNPKTLTAFELGATQKSNLNLERLKGRWTFLFFGYTFCPDVCPTTLSTMAKVTERLRAKEGEEDVQVVFVSVDPARDALDHLSEYLGYFDKTFIGATAPLEQLDSFTRQLGILHFRDAPDDNGNYLVDHTASILLIDPGLRFVGVFQAPHSAEKITSAYLSIKDFVESQS